MQLYSKSTFLYRVLSAAALFSALTTATSLQAEDLSSDPLEGYNRAVFSFNEVVDDYVFEPVARGYDFIVPNPVQDSVGNFFVNIRTPAYLVSDLIQLKFGQMGNHSARFLINTTLGVAGLFDVADSWFEIPFHYEDFGTGLGYNGVGPGAYFVIPFLGPSTIRDAFGRIVDAFLNPTFYVRSFTDLSKDEAFYTSAGLYLLDSINSRADLLDAVETGKEASLDYYLFIRSVYGQVREQQIFDKKLESEVPEDNRFDFGDEEEPEAPAPE